MADGFMDDITIPVTCKCGRKHSETVGRLKLNNKIVCSCGTTLDIDLRGTTDAFDGINKSVENLKRTIGRLNKR